MKALTLEKMFLPDDTLLQFEENHPCWTERMTALAGGRPEDLRVLRDAGLLEQEGEVYSLTAEGAQRFRQSAAESFLPLNPASPRPADKRREADRSLLQLLLDRRHIQRWGLKEYVKPFRFELPDLRGKELFTLEEKEGKNEEEECLEAPPQTPLKALGPLRIPFNQRFQESLTWHYPDAPVFKNMARDFPLTGLAARGKAPAPERVARWLEDNAPRRRTMEVDLLYKSRYDFQAYLQFQKSSPVPCDPCGLLDTDRFFCFFAPPDDKEILLTLLGEFHMFLAMLRRMILPGYADLDSLEQDGVNWLLYVCEREEDAVKCAASLAPLGCSLAGSAAPMEVWSLSLEALWERQGTVESIHDLLPCAAHPIRRVLCT